MLSNAITQENGIALTVFLQKKDQCDIKLVKDLIIILKAIEDFDLRGYPISLES